MFKYEKIAQELIELIEKGVYRRELPSERELAKMYDTSRGTIRKVVEVLKKENYVNSARGSGTFLNKGPIEQNLNNIYSLTEDIRKSNYELKTEILDYKLVKAEKDIAEKMFVEEGEYLHYLKRLRFIDGEPCILEENYLSTRLYPKVEVEKLLDSSLYKYLADTYLNIFTEIYEEFTGIISSKETKKLFKAKEDLALIKIERSSYAKDLVGEYTIGLVKGDKFKYTVKLK